MTHQEDAYLSYRNVDECSLTSKQQERFKLQTCLNHAIIQEHVVSERVVVDM